MLDFDVNKLKANKNGQISFFKWQKWIKIAHKKIECANDTKWR